MMPRNNNEFSRALRGYTLSFCRLHSIWIFCKSQIGSGEMSIQESWTIYRLGKSSSIMPQICLQVQAVPFSLANLFVYVVSIVWSYTCRSYKIGTQLVIHLYLFFFSIFWLLADHTRLWLPHGRQNRRVSRVRGAGFASTSITVGVWWGQWRGQRRSWWSTNGGWAPKQADMLNIKSAHSFNIKPFFGFNFSFAWFSEFLFVWWKLLIRTCRWHLHVYECKIF